MPLLEGCTTGDRDVSIRVSLEFPSGTGVDRYRVVVRVCTRGRVVGTCRRCERFFQPFVFPLDERKEKVAEDRSSEHGLKTSYTRSRGEINWLGFDFVGVASEKSTVICILSATIVSSCVSDSRSFYPTSFARLRRDGRRESSFGTLTRGNFVSSNRSFIYDPPSAVRISINSMNLSNFQRPALIFIQKSYALRLLSPLWGRLCF